MSLARRSEAAISALDDSWSLWPSMPQRIVEVLGRALGGWSVAIHHWQAEKFSLDAHNLGFDPTSLPWVTDGIARRARLYDPENLGSDADRVVVGEELRRRHPEKWALFEEWGMRPLEMGDQARALVSGDDGRFMAFVGVFPPRGHRAEGAGIEVFARLLDPISERLRTWALLSRASPAGAAILELIDELLKPAFLVSGDGTVIHANLAARLAYEQTPQWLAAGVSARLDGVRTIPVFDGPRRLYVCLPRDRGIDAERLGAWAANRWELPPRLRTTAAKLIAGCSDKEIASQTGLAFTTVRTYVQAILGHVGVSSRSELLKEAMRALSR